MGLRSSVVGVCIKTINFYNFLKECTVAKHIYILYDPEIPLLGTQQKHKHMDSKSVFSAFKPMLLEIAKKLLKRSSTVGWLAHSILTQCDTKQE